MVEVIEKTDNYGGVKVQDSTRSTRKKAWNEAQDVIRKRIAELEEKK